MWIDTSLLSDIIRLDAENFAMRGVTTLTVTEAHAWVQSRIRQLSQNNREGDKNQ